MTQLVDSEHARSVPEGSVYATVSFFFSLEKTPLLSALFSRSESRQFRSNSRWGRAEIGIVGFFRESSIRRLRELLISHTLQRLARVSCSMRMYCH